MLAKCPQAGLFGADGPDVNDDISVSGWSDTGGLAQFGGGAGLIAQHVVDIIAGVPNGGQSFVVGPHELKRAAKTLLVDSGHEHSAWECAEDGDVAESVVDGAVAANKTGAVEAKSQG